MKHILLTISLIFGATAISADPHPDPFKVMTKGKVIGQDSYRLGGGIETYFIVEYKGDIYRCDIRDYDYACFRLAPYPN
tara:strand:- start:100 stop:336 length:237 start_codon:yes stop_codon:yes gene_type:complete